jgi:hypothetical protein
VEQTNTAPADIVRPVITSMTYAGGSGGGARGTEAVVKQYTADLKSFGAPEGGWPAGTYWCFTGGPGPDHPSQRDPYPPTYTAGGEAAAITPSEAANKLTKG